MANIFDKIFGTYSDRELKRIMPIVDKIEALEPSVKALSDKELKAKTAEFKERLKNGETTDDILPEAFAVVREASCRVLGMRHFRVQLIGGVVLHQGRIAEMKTGEGKTLVATLPAYLNALTGQGVHIVTVNDYLAKRDSEWMGKIYNFLGLSVGLIVHGLDNDERRRAYAADITYGTNNELGFDYLRDNMVIYKSQRVQRGHYFAIVDEVDSILIDEARTPLIISGAGDKSTALYETADKFARTLKKIKIKESDDKQLEEGVDADYIVDEKAHTATLTERGIKKAEAFFKIENLSDPENLTISHHINQAIRAHGIMQRDKDYVVKDGEVIIVDEFTGRLMFGRRYSEGLHQAIEAKEKVKVERESKTLATITFQNYFRLYKKLSGMTGTAQTEEAEFQAIYKLDVIVIPTNMPLIRIDHPDAVYKNEAGKFNAVIEQIKRCHEKGQPVLVGTITIEKSEKLSAALKKIGIPHEVLNAKFHEKEAEIVAQAGKKGAVTIATNMAGRGTDIVLGGNAEFMAKREMAKLGFEPEMINEATSFADTDNEEILNARATYKELYEKYKPAVLAEREEVINAGGLFIIGTERHESRRIDNQLRGRSGRQGDVGESKFYISLEDDLMRLFGSERLMGMVETLGLEDDQPIEAKILSNAIESAQKKVEGRNFDIRKHVLQYDDVMNQQRELIYAQRSKVLEGENLRDYILSMIDSVAKKIVDITAGESEHGDDFSWETFYTLMLEKFGIVVRLEPRKCREITKDELLEFVLEASHNVYEKKEQQIGSEAMRELERIVLLQVVDNLWMDHIDAMDQLRSGIGLRAYAQKDPVIEYKFEGMDMFEEMIASIKEETVRHIYHARVNTELKREQVAKPVSESLAGAEDNTNKPVKKSNKVGRNEPCPCGSGKKYKKCCGQ
ncbi:MAG: preprotein translocase subunit SecA [Firmicutes bacterium ADurb.Bin193]|nr:MAG: preprotein translocase subunit SecA [Firmicutes bacterium ADurb.Bin193]